MIRKLKDRIGNANLFFILVIITYIILAIININLITPALNIFYNIIKKIIPIFITVFVLMFILNIFLTPKRALKYFIRMNI